MKAVRVLCFDLDDTIWDNRPVLEFASKTQRAFLSTNFPAISNNYDEPKLKQLWRSVALQYVDKSHDFTFLRQKVLEKAAKNCGVDPEIVVPRTLEVFLQARSNVTSHVFPGVLDVLRRLKAKGYILVSCTNGNARLKHAPDLNDLFEHQVSAETAGAAKPNELPFLQVLDLTGASAEEVVHVGDSLTSDVTGAVNAGMRAVWVNRHSEESSDIAHATIRCVSEIESILGHL
mmetsp:Transcript_8775/g.10040  ORF Transcript_8775/g.10040 Transcript_8775/m.10040 type:complete len:232 (-) Transcript_8775:2720-3415(-)